VVAMTTSHVTDTRRARGVLVTNATEGRLEGRRCAG
jgi:hypothetical protein